MNPKSFLIFFFVINVFTSCSDEPKKETENSEVHFVIEGTVKNGNGKELALHIPSLNLDNRLISRVENGKFKFEGSIPKPEGATISFEDEHKNIDGAMSIYQVFLTNETIQLRAEVVEQYGNLFLRNDTLLNGRINQYYHKIREEFSHAYSGAMIYRDSIRQDSMRNFVYPMIRRNVLRKYDESFSSPEHSVIALFYLRTMLEDNYIFNFNDLKKSEKDQLIDHFNKLPTSLEGTPDYTVVASHVARLKNPESSREFQDFSLPDLGDVEHKLSEVIKRNNYTVLDFWWSGCRPCRVFNKESQESYSDLREAGIEIVGINVDDGREKWERASKMDSLSWINLYAGANSKIQSDYNVKAFPTKIVVDKNFDIVDIDFKTAKELLAVLRSE